MNEEKISLKIVILSVFIFSVITSIIFFRSFFYHNTKIVFCDVGQGDAAYIRTPEGIDIMIDAGPNDAVLSCLGRYMPFYDRQIEYAFLSHPQKDHYGGFISILERFRVINIILPNVNNNNQSYRQLKDLLSENLVNVKNMYAGNSLQLSKDTMVRFLWPKPDYFSTDLNDFSAIILFSYRQFDIVFTGDAGEKVLNLVDDSFKKIILSERIEILKVPHHGSKNGLSRSFLSLVKPVFSVISVGRKNSYGHPSKLIIDMFKLLNKKYLTTASEGNIVFEADEKHWRRLE